MSSDVFLFISETVMMSLILSISLLVTDIKKYGGNASR